MYTSERNPIRELLMHREVQLDFTPEMEVFYLCCLRVVILKIETDLSNSIYITSISGVKFSWTALHVPCMNLDDK